MKVLGMTQYKAAEQFLFPSCTKSVAQNAIRATKSINHVTNNVSYNTGRTNFFKECGELFSPLFKALSKIFD